MTLKIEIEGLSVIANRNQLHNELKFISKLQLNTIIDTVNHSILEMEGLSACINRDSTKQTKETPSFKNGKVVS